MPKMRLTCPTNGSPFDVGEVESVKAFEKLCAEIGFVPIHCSACGQVHRCRLEDGKLQASFSPIEPFQGVLTISSTPK